MRARTGVCLLLLLSVLPAQETRPSTSRPARRGAVLEWLEAPLDINLDLKARTLCLVGNVHVRVGDLTLRCDNLFAWGAESSGTGPAGENEKGTGNLARARHLVREIYAEGSIVITEGDRIERCDKAYLDLTHERGLFIDATLRWQVPTPTGPQLIVVRAEEVRVLAKNRLEALSVRTTTSPFAKPPFHVRSDRIEVIREPPGVIGSGANAREITNTRFTAEGNTLYTGGIPIFWFPDLGGDTVSGSVFRYLQNIRYRKSNRFGHEVEVVVGDQINQADGTRWGNWSVLLDYLSKRGFGGGVDVEYETKTHVGRVTARYQRDHGVDHFFGRPSTKNRGRVSVWHRQRLPAQVTVDVEINAFSDRGFYPTFFEREFKGDKPPENLLYVKKTFFNAMLSATANKRFNDWLSVTEYLPELRFDLVREPLVDLFGSTLHADTTVRLTHVRKRLDAALNVPDREMIRADADSLLELPVLIGPAKLTPFGGVRYSFFEEDLMGRRDRDRLGLTFGATLSAQAWKTFEASGGIFDLDGLRHVVMPEVTFRNTVGVDLPASQLVQFDDIDRFDNEQAVELRLRNVLQTIRRDGSRPFVDTVIDLETRINYYPNARRDNLGDAWGNLDADLLVRFGEAVQLTADGEVDLHDSELEVFNTSIGITPDTAFQTYAGYRHFEGLYDVVFLQAIWQPEEKWILSLETSYELSEDRGLDHRVAITRISQDWVLRFSLRADVGKNDYSIGIAFFPRLLFNPVRSPRSLRQEPRFHYLGSGHQH